MASRPSVSGAALLIFGGGFFKTNTTAQVGMLYGAGDPRRDRAYSVFYIGINLGALLAPIDLRHPGRESRLALWFRLPPAWACCWRIVVYLLGWRDLPPEPIRVKVERRTTRAPHPPGMEIRWRAISAGDPAHAILGLQRTTGQHHRALWSIDIRPRDPPVRLAG